MPSRLQNFNILEIEGTFRVFTLTISTVRCKVTCSRSVKSLVQGVLGFTQVGLTMLTLRTFAVVDDEGFTFQRELVLVAKKVLDFEASSENYP